MANATIAVTITRPANTTAYTANGVGLANAIAGAVATQIAGFAAGNNGTALLAGIVCNTNLNTCQYTLRLHFFKAAPGTAINDNATFNILTADDANYLGWFDMPGLATRGASSTTASSKVDATQIMQAMQSDGSNVLWMMVEIINAFNTPANPSSAQTFKFLFSVIQ